MTSKEWLLDEHLTKVVKDEWEQAPQPPLTSSEAWERLRQTLPCNDNKKSKLGVFLSSRIFKGTAAAILLAGAFAIIAPTQTGMAFSWITKYFTSVEGPVTNITISNQAQNLPEPNSPPRIELIGASQELEHLTLQEAQEKVDFPIHLPNWLPEGYELRHANALMEPDGSCTSLTLVYRNDSGEGELQLQQRKIAGAFGETIGFDNEDTAMKETMVNGHGGKLLWHKDGSTTLFWFQEPYHFQVRGSLSEEQIVRIAESVTPSS